VLSSDVCQNQTWLPSLVCASPQMMSELMKQRAEPSTGIATARPQRRPRRLPPAVKRAAKVDGASIKGFDQGVPGTHARVFRALQTLFGFHLWMRALEASTPSGALSYGLALGPTAARPRELHTVTFLSETESSHPQSSLVPGPAVPPPRPKQLAAATQKVVRTLLASLYASNAALSSTPSELLVPCCESLTQAAFAGPSAGIP
jgi:hypothetical protein